MTRITKAMTDEIVSSALAKSGVTAGEAELKKDRLNWLERVRVSVLGGEVAVTEMQNTLAKISKLRKELPNEIDLGYQIAKKSKIIRLNIAGLRIDMEFPERTISPGQLTITADNPLTEEFHALETRREDLDKRKAEVKASVRAAVSRFTTVAKLLAEWPEAAELIPKGSAAPKTNLPVVQVADLNKLVGLPTA